MYEYLEGRSSGSAAARASCSTSPASATTSSCPLGSSFPRARAPRVWTHLVVREDAHTLYGFPDRETRDLFRALLTVRGVGPRMALGVLSGLPRDELLAGGGRRGHGAR